MVSGDGKALLTNDVPPGKYTVSSWNRGLGGSEDDVRILSA